MNNNNNNILKDYKKIEEKIGYTFINKHLLFQAFTRKSYAEEHGRGLHNDNLEFLGDQILSYYVTKYIMQRHGYIKTQSKHKEYDDNFFALNAYSDAKQLTKIKKDFVDNEMLSHRIDELDLADYLIVGNVDTINDVKHNIKIKGDLFESIVGAVAIDSNYDSNIMENVVHTMLNIDFYMIHGFDIDRDDYRTLVNVWYQKNTHNNIVYTTSQVDGVVTAKSVLHLKDRDETFIGEGHNIEEAKKMCAKAIYRREVTKPIENDKIMTMLSKAKLGDSLSLENSVSFMNFLYQQKLIEEPIYDIPKDPSKLDDNGNPIWMVVNKINITNDKKTYVNNGYAYKIKDAKKIAAYLNLCQLLNIKPEVDENGSLLKKD